MGAGKAGRSHATSVRSGIGGCAMPRSAGVVLARRGSHAPWAQRTEPLPEELKGVGVTEHLDEQIPLDLEFVDSDGKPVKLQAVLRRQAARRA